MNRLPIGILPHFIWVEERLKDIREAIKRYVVADEPIPEEWINEYVDLLANNSFDKYKSS